TGAATLSFVHRDHDYSGRTEITALPDPDQVDRLGLTWHMKMQPHEVKRIRLVVRLVILGEPLAPHHDLGDFGLAAGARPSPLLRDASEIVVPSVRTSWDKLHHVYQRSLMDLNALLIDDPLFAAPLPAAGLPWFMTVFGRDTLITSYQVLPGGRGLA